jgi:hypothetical protein
MRYGDLALFLAGALCFEAQAHSEARISGPYSHDNLSIFLIQQSDDTAPIQAKGGSRASKARYLALQPAMEQKKVVIYETKQVNDLAIENLSAEPVFIQQGDLVKGGDQDRMISNDFILPPKSGRLPLAAFCVEQGRWSQRGNESARAFSGSTALGAVAFDPRSMWSQMSVWNKVTEIQDALASGLRKQRGAGLASVRAPASPTSLVLTQTSPAVEEAAGAYMKALAGAPVGKARAVGYAFAVNGEVKSADIYASPELFSAMWPKLLKSSAVEALRLREKGTKVPPQGSQVEAFLREADGGKETTRDVDRRVKLVMRESERQMLVESREGENWVHRRVLKK